MEPVTWGFIGALVGTIVGAFASIATTFITTISSRKLLENAASLERSERAREFQRGNLLELQDALSNCMRLIGRAHHEDMESFRKNKNQDINALLSEELDQDLMISNRKIAILTERTSDQDLRKNIKLLRNEMTNVLMARTDSKSYAALKCAASTFEKTMEELGSVLRGSY